jgi:hypothetical protein
MHIGAIHELTYMIRLDRERAVNAFEKLLLGHEILLETMYIREFIYRALYKNFLRLHPYILTMMNHLKENVQEQGAQLACIAEISSTAMESEEAFNAAQKLAEQTTSITAPLPWKRGAARIYARNVTGSPKDTCLVKLKELLNEEDKQIHDSVGRIFYSLNEGHFYSMHDFIETFAEKSKSENHKFAEYLLEHCLVDPEWTLSIVQKSICNNDLFNQSSWSIGVEDIIRLVLRIYTNPTVSGEAQKTAMNLFDILMERNPDFSQKVLSEWDKR